VVPRGSTEEGGLFVCFRGTLSAPCGGFCGLSLTHYEVICGLFRLRCAKR
jgi:hypothetical protein